MEHFLQEHVHYFMEPAKCKIYLCLEGDLPSMNQTIRNKIFKKGQLSTYYFSLHRAGTKSTKDSSLDKPVRKGPGLLLEAAGRSLLNKAGGGSTHNYKSGGSSILSGGATSGGLSFGLVSSKISFGLYGGHLPVDHGSYTKSKDGDSSPTSESSNNR